MLNLKISIATEDMCDKLATIKKHIWETTYTGIYDDTKLKNYNHEKQAQKFKQCIDSKNIELYVAIIDEEIIGYVAIGISPHRPNGNIELAMLNILKNFQGLGIGKALFDFAKEKIKHLNNTGFNVYCNKYNVPAQNFYKKMGCVIVAIDDDTQDKSIPQVKFEYRF